MSNKSRTLYTGYTGDLVRRVREHKKRRASVFTGKYNIDKLVYYERQPDRHSAKQREKQIKGWLRAKKIILIESMNLKWTDLSSQAELFLATDETFSKNPGVLAMVADPSVSKKRTPQDFVMEK